MKTQKKPTKKDSKEMVKNYILGLADEYKHEWKKEPLQMALKSVSIHEVNDILKQEYRIIEGCVYDYPTITQEDLNKIKEGLQWKTNIKPLKNI